MRGSEFLLRKMDQPALFRRAHFPAVIATIASRRWRAPEPWDRNATTRFHHGPQRRGGVAARGTRAAVGEAADHRALGPDHAFRRQPTGYRVCATAARTRMDRGAHRRDRVSLVGGP